MTENFTTLDETGKLRIFESCKDIINYFVKFRLEFYTKRKNYLLDKLTTEFKTLNNKARFITMILEDKLEIKNKSKDSIVGILSEESFDKYDDSYDYLLRMPLWSLTKELYDKIKSDLLNKQIEIDKINKIEPKDMYLQDLSDLKKKLK